MLREILVQDKIGKLNRICVHAKTVSKALDPTGSDELNVVGKVVCYIR